MKKIFISQEVLDRLFAENKADLKDNLLTIYTRQNQEYELTPAYKFVSVADNSADKNSLVGKIYAKSEMEKINADIYMDSAIIKDVPYNIETGYIGEPKTPAAEPEPSAQAQKSEADENDLLADYLLKIL